MPSTNTLAFLFLKNFPIMNRSSYGVTSVDPNTKTFPRFEMTSEQAADLNKRIGAAVNKLNRHQLIPLQDIYIAMPYHVQLVIGHYQLCRYPGDRPKQMFGCQIIPAYENMVTIFFDECHLAEIKPISLDLIKPF